MTPLERLRRDIPYPVLLATAWAGCIIVIGVALWGLSHVASRLTPVIVPVAVAILLAAMLEPVVLLLHRRCHVPRSLACLISEFGLLALVVAGFTLAGAQVTSGIRELVDGAGTGVDTVTSWLEHGPLHLSIPAEINIVEQARKLTSFAGTGASALATGALELGLTTADAIAGFLITLFALYFFLYQGRSIWRFSLNFVPSSARRRFDEAMRAGWESLGAYARMQIGVAAINGGGIGIGAWLLGLPLVVPITVVVFLCSFVPILGALVSGAFAVLIALVDGGFWMAVIMLIVVCGVHLVEVHLLQPFLMGHAVRIHPLAVIVVVAVGTYLAGLPGALFAVPLTAMINSSVRRARALSREEEAAETTADVSAPPTDPDA
ncbi:AI-2E family transporter [Corynebacterium uropygiale]|uniref:AI-2E family transporter n=1 Tax=Corynebacterium uropygiale TaxID=1775911 RepID=A0A9X1QRG0_9CORY|nr:AI-2E family transporter [Corynebacterium uropygiale]MCF4006820.1 AI-2E family transporter [Corynebacterium uropygiale]